MLGILGLLLWLGFIICWIIVLIKLFQNEGALKGILGLICWLYTFIWGWMNGSKLSIPSGARITCDTFVNRGRIGANTSASRCCSAAFVVSTETLSRIAARTASTWESIGAAAPSETHLGGPFRVTT